MAMSWYVSYRRGGGTVMHVFESRDLAIEAAWRALDQGHKDALCVGPMLGNPEGNTLSADDLIQLRKNRATTVAVGEKPTGPETG